MSSFSVSIQAPIEVLKDKECPAMIIPSTPRTSRGLTSCDEPINKPAHFCRGWGKRLLCRLAVGNFWGLVGGSCLGFLGIRCRFVTTGRGFWLISPAEVCDAEFSPPLTQWRGDASRPSGPRRASSWSVTRPLTTTAAGAGGTSLSFWKGPSESSQPSRRAGAAVHRSLPSLPGRS